MTRRTRQRGFTLVELLVVVAIIGLLASIAIPVYLRFLDRSRTTAIAADLRAIHTALIRYNADHGSFPAAFDVATMSPLAAQGYFGGVESLQQKLQPGSMIYVTWSFNGPNSDVMIRANAAHDPDMMVYALHYASPSGSRWDGVYFHKNGVTWTPDEID